MKFPATDVLRIFRLLEEGGVPVWLDGGWGIDALLQRETRMHRDMDLIVPLDCLAAAELALGEVGFSKDEHETNLPTRLVLRNCEGLEIDIHPVTFKPDGSAVHIHTEVGGGLKYMYVYSSVGLSGVGIINGRVVRCTTAAEQIRQKVERRYSPWSENRIGEHGVSADLEDICSLLQVFGVDAAPPEAPPAGNAVVDATKQFCLQHMASLSAQHSLLSRQHAELGVQHAELGVQHAELGARHAELCTKHSLLIAEHAELIAHIHAIRASTSWQLTAPMRWAVKWLGLGWLKLRTQ